MLIFPETFEAKTGFSSVRKAIARKCASKMGVELTEEMSFSSDFAEIESRLTAVDEMKRLIASDDSLPLGKIRDIRPILSHIRIAGTFPTVEQTASIRKTLEGLTELRRFLATTAEETSDDENARAATPVLASIVEPMALFPELLKRIDSIIDPLGNIRDNASQRLAEIRNELRHMAGSIASIMRRIMSHAISEGLIEADATPAMRDGRLVIPVAPMHKRKIRGIVHDESATGKTVFIEPAEVVEANNRQRTLQIDEHREEVRILTELADYLRPYIPDIEPSLAIAGLIDFIHAKALYAVDVDGEMPMLENECELEWFGARHPVLLESLRAQNRAVVPLDITLTPEKRLLVISGPNAGGKSVCLKTVGIIQYMAQCGVLPTLHSNSRIGVFSEIFIDIGDNQSIEDDLSTYSSHLRNMKEIVRSGTSRSIVLIDEFGSGTEPLIGGAIAQAILRRMNDTGMWGVVTTHYQNLKQFAEETPGLVNGSMLYDRQQMRPLFRLSIGNPGSSFALEIARKTGLPADIISDAEEIAGSDYVNLDKYLLDIARDKRYWENKRQSIRLKEKKIDEVVSRYEHDAEELRERRREIIATAKEEARRIVTGTNAAIERTILEIRQSQAEKEQTREARRRLADELGEITSDNIADHPVLKKADKKKKKNSEKTTRRPAAEQTEKPKVGTNVRLDGKGTVGTILAIEKDKATVSFGLLKTTVALSRLKPTSAAVDSGARASGLVSDSTYDSMRSRQLNFKQEIDVRGMRADEALQAVTYFIDDAIQFGIGRVRILHGTGTGALRQAIRSYLAGVPQAESYADEDVRFGGAGITVVNLG